MHSGKAAGAVIGKVRAFYCIYGQTVNTASRLCKYASLGHMHCSQGFITALKTERATAASRAPSVLGGAPPPGTDPQDAGKGASLPLDSLSARLVHLKGLGECETLAAPFPCAGRVASEGVRREEQEARTRERPLDVSADLALGWERGRESEVDGFNVDGALCGTEASGGPRRRQSHAPVHFAGA